MPFSSLSDPTDLARAYAALEAVWNEVKGSIPDEECEKERMKIAYIVASLVPQSLDEEELTQSVLLRYRRLVAA